MRKAIISAIVLLSLAAMAENKYEGRVFQAGGKWTFHISHDKLTGAEYGLFVLEADQNVTDGISSGKPEFVVMCGGSAKNPKWINSKLISPVVLGLPQTRSPFSGSPQQLVNLRTDDKIHGHFWNIADDYRTMFVDKGATREFLHSSEARVQFRDADGHDQVAVFTTAGLDRKRAAIACGEIMK